MNVELENMELLRKQHECRKFYKEINVPRKHSSEELTHTYIYTGWNRRNGPNFGRVFLMLNYTEKTQNTYIQS